MGAVHCAKCGEVVIDHRAHLAEALHDRFEVRLPSGLRVSLGDMGLDQEAAAEEERRRVEAERTADAQLHERTVENAQRLTDARAALETALQARAEAYAVDAELGAISIELPGLEQRYQEAGKSVLAARRGARAVLERGRQDALLLGGTPWTDAEWARCVDLSVPLDPEVERTELVERERSQAFRTLYERRETLRSELRWLRPWLADVLPERQQAFDAAADENARLTSEAITRQARRLLSPREKQPIQGLALWKAQNAHAMRHFLSLKRK